MSNKRLTEAQRNILSEMIKGRTITVISSESSRTAELNYERVSWNTFRGLYRNDLIYREDLRNVRGGEVTIEDYAISTTGCEALKK